MKKGRANRDSGLGPWVVLGAASIAAGARVTVDMEPVPMTLQTLAVLIVGGLLGGRRGAWAATLYLGAVLAGA
ncbi:MAG: biotin transporter BioY, partial [Planctomycetota bacterium]